jgi:hypothetical protein
MSASTGRSVTRGTGNECGRNQGKLIIRMLVQQMKKLPVDFSANATQRFYGKPRVLPRSAFNILYYCNYILCYGASRLLFSGKIVPGL